MDEEEMGLSRTGIIGLKKMIFDCAQRDQTNEVMHWFNLYPQFINSFKDARNWNPFFYAIRNQNQQLINYFIQKNARVFQVGSNAKIWVTDIAVVSKSPALLQYLFKKIPIPFEFLQSQYKILQQAMNQKNTRMIDFLISRGAYYVTEDVSNNVQFIFAKKQQGNIYRSLLTNNLISSKEHVVEQQMLESPQMKDYLKLARVRNMLNMRQFGKREKSKQNEERNKFSNLADILCENDYFNLMLRAAVGNGRSLNQMGNE